MDQSIIEQVKEAIAPLASKLQQGTEFLYRVYLKQTIVDALINFILWLAIILGLWFVVRIVLKRLPDSIYGEWADPDDNPARRKRSDKNVKDNRIGTKIRIYIILSIITLASMAIPVGSIKRLLNPNYYTIQHIVTDVRGVK